MPVQIHDTADMARHVAGEVLILARAGIPFADARSMDEVERRAYLDALAMLPVPAPVEHPARREPEPERSGLSFIA